MTEFKRHYEVKYARGKGGRPSKVDTAQALGMILQFYANTIGMKTLGQLHGCRSNTASRIVQKAELALEKTLKVLPQATIRWPSKEDQQRFARLIEEKYPLVKNRFGFIDGKNYDVQQPSHADLQNAMYNGWLHRVFVTGCICIAVDGCIIWAKHNAVGSWNDGDTSRELQDKLLDERFCDPEYGIVSDTAFPVGVALMRKIVSPLKEGELERARPEIQGVMLINLLKSDAMNINFITICTLSNFKIMVDSFKRIMLTIQLLLNTSIHYYYYYCLTNKLTFNA